MRVRDLKKILESAPDDAFVVVPAPDHSYRSNIRADIGTALYGGHVWTEDYGEEYTPEGDEFGKRIRVVIIR